MESRFWFILKWTGSTVVGWGLGMILTIIFMLIPDDGIPYPHSIISATFILVLSVTLLQGYFVLTKVFSVQSVIYLSIVTAALCAVAQYFLTLYLPTAVEISIYEFRLWDGWLSMTFFSSILFGVSLGLPQWILLKSYQQTEWRLFDNMVAIFTAFLFLMTIGKANNITLGCSFFCLSPIIFALITGLTLYNIIMRKPKPKNVEG